MAEEETTQETTEEKAPESSLGLSDEEFMKAGSIEELYADDYEDAEETSAETTEDTEEEETSEDIADEATEETETEDTTEETSEDTESEESSEPEETIDESGENTEEAIEDEKESSDVDYKAEYAKLLAPFNANGSQMQIKNVDEAITLMQMGANYYKKMAGLKPSLKIVKLLDKNNLLDLDKINYLIDLHSKKPEAITKLVKDSGVNPLDIESADEEQTDYVPEARNVTDAELELDNVLDNIKDTPTYSKTIQVITEQWDEPSRQLIADAPHIIGLINEHMANGIYDAIAPVVAREKSLGKLNGCSDLEAYKQVGDMLHSQSLLPGQTPPVKTPKKSTVTKPDVIAEKIRKKQKKAVSTTKTKPNSPSKADFNPLALSDEEFEKLSSSKFV